MHSFLNDRTVKKNKRMGSGQGFGGNKNKKKWMIIAGSVVAVIIVALVIYLVLPKGLSEEEINELYRSGTYLEGVSIEGVDVSGMTLKEARDVVNKKAAQTIGNMEVNFTVADKQVVLTSGDFKVTSNVEDVLEQAMVFGRTGDDPKGDANKATQEGVNFDLTYEIDRENLQQVLVAKGEEYGLGAQDAAIIIEKDSDENQMTTTGEVVYQEAQPGYNLASEDLMNTVIEKALAGDKEVFEAQVEIIEPEVTKDMIEGEVVLLGRYTTEYSEGTLDREGRKYNIWKMCDIINGIEIKPGETWSINDEAGPRSVDAGWALAPRLENGQSTDQPGGGICQVSSTLYYAAMLAELDIVDRSHHSWPSSYITIGLDAAISTGGPDLKIKNDTDSSVYIIAECSGVDEEITVSVYGPPKNHDYEVRYRSEIVEEVEPGEPESTLNEDLAPGEKVIIVRARTGKRVDVYKEYYDSDGNLVESEKIYQDYYRPYNEVSEHGPDVSDPEDVPDDMTTDIEGQGTQEAMSTDSNSEA